MSLATINGRGFIIADIDFKYIGERAVANFPVAFNQDKKNEQSGQWEKDKSAVIRCAAWGELAEYIKANFSAKTEIDLSGAFFVREYEKGDGSKGSSAELTVRTVGAPVAKKQQAGGYGSNTQAANNPADSWA